MENQKNTQSKKYIIEVFDGESEFYVNLSGYDPDSELMENVRFVDDPNFASALTDAEIDQIIANLEYNYGDGGFTFRTRPILSM